MSILRRVRMLLVCLTAAVACAACAEYDDQPYRKDTQAVAMDTVPADCATAKTFTQIRSELFPKCAGSTCHDSGNESNVVVFDAVNMPYETIVAAKSKTVPSLYLVEPNRPSRSFLYRKISATHIGICEAQQVSATRCGGQMPLNDWFGLPTEVIEDTRFWIACGAPR